MARPRHDHPTPAELEVLQIIWRHGPCTVRQMMEMLEPTRPRAYTSVMSLMTVMSEKSLLRQKQQGRAYLYSARVSREKTRVGLLKDLLNRAFDGSANALVVHLLEQTDPTSEELEALHKAINDYKRKKGD